MKLSGGVLVGCCFLAVGGWWFLGNADAPSALHPNPASEEVMKLAAAHKPGNNPPGPITETTAPPPPPAAAPPQVEAPQEPPAPPQFVLDEYPEMIRASLLDTVNGVVSDMPPAGGVGPAVEQKPADPPNGNIFKLLESASNKSPDKTSLGAPVYVDGPPPPAAYDGPGSAPFDPPPPPPPLDEEGEQAKREAIRQKFLEAIRAAAERRAAGEGQ
jgi:hypothetical protein